MGLDQYLWAEKFVGGNAWESQDNQNTYKSILGEIKAEEMADTECRLIEVKMCAIYWRKANHIHKWFVDNVQDGLDDCNRYRVGPKQLVDLHENCVKARDTRDPSILPPTVGPFFGSTDLDEYYWGEIERTAKNLKRVLSIDGVVQRMQEGPPLFRFFYQSSW